jgi:type IV secretion system protein VirD4
LSSHAPIYNLGEDHPNARIGIYLTPILAVVGAIALLLWAVTEWVAWKFGFHANLGPPLLDPSVGVRVGGMALAFASFGLAVLSIRVERLRRGLGVLLYVGAIATVGAVLPLYAPWSVFVWALRFGDAPGAEPVFGTAWHAIVIPAHFLFLVAMYVAWRRARRNARNTDAYGSARWASASEIEKTGLLNGDGVFLGVVRERDRDKGTYLRHSGPQHVLGFAPTRSGKGVGWVIPTLLTWQGSVLVHDIKGENWALTAGWRAARVGNRCLKFDPTCADGSGARYNPLLEVRRGALEIRDAQNIADILVDPDGRGVKDHWDLTAEEVLVASILHVLYVGRNKTLRGCLELLTDPQTDIKNTLSRMKTTVHDPEAEFHWRDPVTEEPTRTHPVVAGTAQSLLNKSDNERSSVISSAVKCLSLLRDDIVARNTGASDFAIDDLMTHREPVSLYLVVPPSDLSRTKPLMRLLINQVGRRLTESLHPREGEGAKRHRLLLMMDEFPALGRLDFFQSQLAYLAGYGIKAFLVVQDLSQLYAAYGQTESIVSNCHVRVAYAPNKVETAQLLSTMAGLATVRKGRRMYSGNRLAPWLSHVMESEEEMQRPLITPDEVMRLPDENALVFVAGHRPIWAMKGRYFEDPRLERRSRLPPPSRCEPIQHRWNTWAHVEPIGDQRAGVLGAPEERDVDAELAARSSVAAEEGHDDLLVGDLDDDEGSAAAALA